MLDIDNFDSVMRLNQYERLIVGYAYVTKGSSVLVYLGSKGDNDYFIKLGSCVVKEDRRPGVYKVLDGNIRFNRKAMEDFITYIYLNEIERGFIGFLKTSSLNMLGVIGSAKGKLSLASNILDRIIEDYLFGMSVGHRRCSCYNSSVMLVKGCEYINIKTKEKLIYIGLQCCSGVDSTNFTDHNVFLVKEDGDNTSALKLLKMSLNKGVNSFRFDVDLNDLTHTYKYYRGLNVDNFINLAIQGY